MNKHNDNNESRIFWGIAFILAGVIWISEYFGYIPWRVREYLFTWQALLIGLGLLSFFIKRNKIGGIILMGIGGYFMIEEFAWLPYNIDRFFWPGLLILVGIAFLLKRDDWMPNNNTTENDLKNNK